MLLCCSELPGPEEVREAQAQTLQPRQTRRVYQGRTRHRPRAKALKNIGSQYGDQENIAPKGHSTAVLDGESSIICVTESTQ